MLNQVNIMGRLTQDPVLRRTETGRDVTNITLACDRNYAAPNGRASVDFVDAVLWGTLAQTAFVYLTKGSLVVLEGHLTQIKRRDTAGKDIWQLQLVADRIHFADRKRKSSRDLEPTEQYGAFTAADAPGLTAPF